MQIKLLAVFAFILFFMVILLVRIAFINVKSGQRYAKQVLSQENYDSKTLYSRRGEIQDTNGRLLAYSERQYDVILDCYAVNQFEENEHYEDYVKAVTDALSIVFQVDEEKIRTLITDEKTKKSQYQIILQNITENEKDAYEEYASLSSERDLSEEERLQLERLSLTGAIWFEETYERKYPEGSLASNVIGFANTLGDGICGLEAYYDSMLKGTDGRVFGYLNENQEYQKKTIDPKNGYTLQTTIDINIQQIVEKYIAQFDETYGTDNNDGTAKHGAKNVGVVVMNPNNGAVLAMATNSSFDLNNPQDLTPWYTSSQRRAMSEKETSEALNTIWKNFCITDGYEPGSVVKPVTMASALECGAITENTGFYCDGGEQVTDTYIKCDNIYGHGSESPADAIKNSCNDALMAVGRAIGVRRFVQYQALFNFGKRTGIDLPNEASGAVYTQKGMNEVELATCAFGQGFTCTMIQEIAAICSVVNGGYYYQPHVVEKIIDSEGRTVKSMDQLLLKQTISTEVSETIKSYLEYAVQEGTGRKSQVPGYRTGGKTGTAEKINPATGTRWKGHYLVSFIGAAPIYDPEIVMYVVVDEPNVPNQADSTYAQVLFRQIATELLPYLDVYPTEDVTDTLLQFLGLTRKEVVKDAKITFPAFDSYGNYYNGCYVNDEGVVVTSGGLPVAGAYVRDDGKVIDAYANEVADINQEDEEEEEAIDPKEDNPDMAIPPAEESQEPDNSSQWDATVDPAAMAGENVNQ